MERRITTVTAPNLRYFLPCADMFKTPRRMFQVYAPLGSGSRSSLLRIQTQNPSNPLQRQSQVDLPACARCLDAVRKLGSGAVLQVCDCTESAKDRAVRSSCR